MEEAILPILIRKYRTTAAVYDSTYNSTKVGERSCWEIHDGQVSEDLGDGFDWQPKGCKDFRRIRPLGQDAYRKHSNDIY